MIRRSSNQFMYNYQRSLNRANVKQAKLLEQSDGSSIHRPSDDSIGYSKLLRSKFSRNENNQYQTNVAMAASWMKTSDDALVNMTDIMMTFKTKTVQASNASQTPDDNKAVAKEMMALIQQVVALGNNMQGDRYTFAGQSDQIRPFELSEEMYTRGMAKTLDTKQAQFFNTAETYEQLSQMLTITGEDDAEYYLDTTNGYIYDKRFVDEGYKDAITAGYKTVDPTQHAIAKLGDDFFNETTGADFTNANQQTNFKISDFFNKYGVVLDTVDESGDASVATTGLSFAGPSGEVSSEDMNEQTLTMQAPVDVTAKAGSLLVYYADDFPSFRFGITDGQTVTIPDDTRITLSNGNTYTMATLTEALDSGDLTLSDNTWVRLDNDTDITLNENVDATYYSQSKDFSIHGNKVTIPTGTTFVDSNGDTYTLNDKTKTLNAVTDDGTTMNFKLKTVQQQIVSYSGDNNYISMVKLNGKADQTSDTVNATGADIFGTDLFDGANSGNVASGAAMLNQMLTVHNRTNSDDQNWLNADGVELGDQIHETTNRAETTIGSRQQLYAAVSDMLITQDETIQQDIVDVSGTDVAKLATDLMEQSSVMSLALSMGGRILPMSLADYL